MNRLTLWVDADACPGPVRDIVLKASNRLTLQTVFVANKSLALPRLSHLETVVVDQYILDHALPGDLVVTQDIPLAADLIAKEVVAISPHGTLFSEKNIGERLSVRNMLQDMRDAGAVTSGPKPFNNKAKRQFANTFDQTLTRLLQNR